MQSAIGRFIKAPSAEGLDKTRQAWRDAREFYGQTEDFRFYGGPIDDENGPEGQINAWPLDEAYVDYVEGKPTAGLVNNTQVKITKAALIDANERGGEENISAGWHAVEFLLWGQDLSATGPCNRSYEYYVTAKKVQAARSGHSFDDIQLELGVATQCGQCESCARDLWAECHPGQTIAHLKLDAVQVCLHTPTATAQG